MKISSSRIALMVTLVALASSICPRQCQGENQPTPLQIKLDIMKFTVKERERPIVKYLVLLMNTGENDITVLTKPSGYSMGKDQNKGLHDLEFGLYTTISTDKGYKMIPSLASFHPVTLRKNEATQIELPESDSPLGNPFRRLPTTGKIMVSYHVTKEWGERFGIWHGKISTQPFDIKDSEIMEPEKNTNKAPEANVAPAPQIQR